jgi:hypothetical protein
LAVEGSARGRVVRLLAGIAILAVVLGAGAWLLLDSGDDGPDLGGRLVDGRALEACLREAPKPSADWQVQAGMPNRRTGSSTAEFDVRTYGHLTIYPTETAAAELESRMSSHGEVDAARRWGNVVVTGYEGRATAAQDSVVNDCLERAATITPTG